jgi:hypothetical protein
MHPLAWIALLVSDEYWEKRKKRARKPPKPQVDPNSMKRVAPLVKV